MNRDRRGYETTALVESGGRRHRGQRLLYYFRTPPSVRVGREALDAEGMRLLEQHNPDITFDWDRLVKASRSAAVALSSSGSAAPEPGAREERRRNRRAQGRPRMSTPPMAPNEPGAAEVEVGSSAESDPTEEEQAWTVTDVPDVAPGSAAEAEPVDLPEPLEPAEAVPAMTRLGLAGLKRLRARYADVRARVTHLVVEEPERVELLGKVERLNPDAWRSEEEVAHALEEYEAVFESLRPIVGRQPRPRRL